MITQEHKAKLRKVFLEIYDPSIPRVDLKRKYSHAMLSLNLPWCWPCQVNHTFSEFVSDAEDMSSEEIAKILNLNSTDMPVKKATKKVDTKKATKAVVKAKKAPVVKKSTPVATTPVVKPAQTPAVATTKTRDSSIHGGIKFLYIPKK